MILWAILSFMLCFLLLPFARKIALKYGFIDHPDHRKQHVEPVPPVGGLVIIPVFLLILWISGFDIAQNYYFIAALLMVWGLGAWDDMYHLSAWLKFIIQMAAAALLVAGNQSIIYNLGDLFDLGVIHTGSFAYLFSITCVVLVINAINMIDGLDGLCGGVCFIILSALSCAIAISGGHELIIPVFVLIGGLSGFLVYNYRHPKRQRASLFLGDSGSTAIGLTLSWLFIELSQNIPTKEIGLLHPSLIAFVLSVPVFDAISLFIYRLKQRRSPFSADRRHLHYMLCDYSGNKQESVNLIHGITLVYCFMGVLFITEMGIQPYYMMYLWVIAFCIHFGVICSGVKNIRQNN